MNLVLAHEPLYASECMRLDEELLAKAETGGSNARIYEWKLPSVSVPRSFLSEKIDFSVLMDAGIDFVKRPTGGGVLIHGFDLSYSVGVPRTGGWAGLGIDEAGLLLAQPVLEALIKCGFKAEFRPLAGVPEPIKQALCDTQKSPLDILISGQKVAAFAQRRTAQGLFQHGSVHLRKVPEGVISAVKKAGLGTAFEWEQAGEAVSPLEEFGQVDVGRLRDGLAGAVKGVREPGKG